MELGQLPLLPSLLYIELNDIDISKGEDLVKAFRQRLNVHEGGWQFAPDVVRLEWIVLDSISSLTPGMIEELFDFAREAKNTVDFRKLKLDVTDAGIDDGTA